METPQTTSGFTKDHLGMMPYPEELGSWPSFPISDSEMRFLTVLNEARLDGDFPHYWDRFVAVRKLARHAGRDLTVDFYERYKKLDVDPNWVRDALLVGEVDLVIEQMERLQAVRDSARELASYAMASHTD